MIQTHGNLTVLALIGRAVRSKYRLELPIRGPQKQLLANLLIPRFENVADHPEYFAEFNRSVGILLDGLNEWVSRAAKRQRREEGHVDFRKIFISASTHNQILRDRRMSYELKRTKKHMPDLTL